VLAAGFRQNAIMHIDVDDRAQIAFDSIPGRVFSGRVSNNRCVRSTSCLAVIRRLHL
jgi:hypothetical protein